MLACDTWITESGAAVKMIMQVHDELVFEVAEPQLQSTIDAVRNIMSNAAELKVPLLVDVGYGENWDQAH
jgi:DNA polymerase-1